MHGLGSLRHENPVFMHHVWFPKLSKGTPALLFIFSSYRTHNAFQYADVGRVDWYCFDAQAASCVTCDQGSSYEHIWSLASILPEMAYGAVYIHVFVLYKPL